jgi:hypothetical protein
MVTPKFIIDTMKELDYRYWRVSDSSYNLIYEMFQPVSIEESLRRFDRFLNNASSSLYRIFIYPTNEKLKNGEPKSQGFQYEIMMTESMKTPEDNIAIVKPASIPQNQGFNGIDAMGQVMTNGGMMGGVGLDRYLDEKDRIMTLQLRIQQLEMEKKYLEEKLERRESELRREFDSQMSSESRIQGIINNVLPTFMNGFAGSAPMNGIPNVQEATNTMENTMKDNQQQRILAAVNKLIKLDPDFAVNIEKLASLKEKNPAMYETAVKMLNGM